MTPGSSIQRKSKPEAGAGKTTGPHVFQSTHGSAFLFFGVILPIAAVLFEITSHFCAKHFFDPFPSTNHIFLFLLVPLSNFLAWLSKRRNLSAHYGFMSLAAGMAMGICVMYTLMFLPIAGKCALFIGAFGFGLLGLAPALSLPCIWAAGKTVCHLSCSHKTYFDPHQLEHIGHLIILVMVVAVELPSTLTRVHLAMAAAPDQTRSAEGIRWLRRYGNQEVLLRACYERSGRATDIIGSLYEAADPIAVDEARSIFYKVTGKPFNTVAVPATARATMLHTRALNDPAGLNAGVEDEFDLDTDIAGEAVSGIARGLSAEDSQIQCNIDPDALLADINWSFAFDNSSRFDREARAKITLPPGSVVTRATLTVNNEEHDATIMVRETARAVYRQAVMEHKEDPLLVSTCGPDQILLQCYPVHPGQHTAFTEKLLRHPVYNLKVKLEMVSPLAKKANDEAVLCLPAFAEKNFQYQKRVTVISNVTRPASSNYTSSIDSISISPFQQEDTSKVFVFKRNQDCRLVYCDDKFTSPGSATVERQIKPQQYKLPAKLTVIIDGSASMKEFIPQIAAALKSLPQETATDIVLVADGRQSLCNDANSNTAPFQQALQKLQQYTPVGGQDNSTALEYALTRLPATRDGAILWIHGTQPIAAANKEQITKLLNVACQAPQLYDFQTSSGPVEILTDITSNYSVCHPSRIGSCSDDLINLFHSWQPQPNAEPEFVPSSNATPTGQKTLPALAQLAAYNWLLQNVGIGKSFNQKEANRLARDYHLVSPISSAVVVDPIQAMNPIPVQPAPQPRWTIDDAYASLSADLNRAVDGIFSGSDATVNSFNPFGTLSQSTSQSFSTIVNQLNRLNSVTNAEHPTRGAAVFDDSTGGKRDLEKAKPISLATGTESELGRYSNSSAGAIGLRYAPESSLASENKEEAKAIPPPMAGIGAPSASYTNVNEPILQGATNGTSGPPAADAPASPTPTLGRVDADDTVIEGVSTAGMIKTNSMSDPNRWVFVSDAFVALIFLLLVIAKRNFKAPIKHH